MIFIEYNILVSTVFLQLLFVFLFPQRNPKARPVKLNLKQNKYAAHNVLLITKIEANYQQSYLGDA